jgi:hypothetical protein
MTNWKSLVVHGFNGYHEGFCKSLCLAFMPGETSNDGKMESEGRFAL